MNNIDEIKQADKCCDDHLIITSDIKGHQFPKLECPTCDFRLYCNNHLREIETALNKAKLSNVLIKQ